MTYPYHERSPLIDPFEEEEEETSFLQKFLTLTCIAIILIIVLLTFIPHGHINPNIPSDNTNIPYQYILSHKSLWYFGYLIETYPVEFNDNDQPEFVLLAEIVSTSPSWAFGNYEVREYRHKFSSDEPYPVKTADSSLKFLTSDVHISLKTKHSDNIIISSNNTSSNNTSPSDLIDPTTCDYMITWRWFTDGYLHRKCTLVNETEFTRISYVKGTTSWGLTFLSDDSDNGVVYATTSSTDYWWHMSRRDVDVKEFAPFPPIIPAIYTAYYDTIQRNRENNNRRHIK